MIEIVPYRASWPDEFQALASRLRKAFGGRALAIHHIGSTSVPGLAAKDVIDLQLTVASLDEPVDALLAEAGFGPAPLRVPGDHCPPGRTLPDAELAKRFSNANDRAANLHLRARGRFNQRHPLLCRDYLRKHVHAAMAYAEVKRQLARRFPDDAESYYAVKDPVFDIVMEGAEAWATSTLWTEPPSDG